MRLNRTALLPYYFLLLFLLLIVLSLLSSLNDQKTPDLTQSTFLEKELSQRLISIQQQLNNFELMNKRRKSEIFYLQKLVQNLSNKTNETNLLNDFNQILNQKVTNLSTNLNFLNNANHLHSNYLDLPSIKLFLPYLDHNLSSLDPAYIHSTKKIKQDVEIVFGIPHVKRPRESYLIMTLKNLIDNLDENGRNNSLFVIMIAETDIEYVQAISAKLDERLRQYIDEGLIEIISAPSNYYPNWNLESSTHKDPMGDPPNRVRWRTKQNLDYAYLMMYCKNKGSFYMQLEDDIMSRPNYYGKIISTVYTQQIRRPDWFVIEFSNLGFIGKLFKSSDLSTFYSFFLMFYRDKPVDWLLENVSKVRYCRNDATIKACKLEMSKHVLVSRPPLFQHLGVYSSMRGKIQKLKEKSFNSKENLFFGHTDNPECKLSTDLITYKSFDLESAYNGNTYFWSLTPRQGNYIQLDFISPIIVDQYRIKSGNWEHSLDLIYNATLSFRPVFKLSSSLEEKYKRDTNGNYIVNEFLINDGKVEGSLKEFGAITQLRIDFKSNLDNWILISEFMIKPKFD